MGRNLMLEIGHDCDVEMPESGYDGWKLISFGRKHSNYEDPDEYVKCFDRGTREVTPANIGLQRKLNVGLAFWLSYYEHGDGAWSLIGEGTQDYWDTAYLAGILIWTGKPGDIGAKTLEDRAKDSSNFLTEYNLWANGHTYCYALQTEDGNDVDSCGEFIGDKALAEAISEQLKDGDRVRVEGDGAWLKDYLSLPDGVELVDEFPELREPEWCI